MMQDSNYLQLRADRYSTFASGAGADFNNGKLSLEDLYAYTTKNGEPKQISGKQELFENLINQYI